jgi:hypothetical protein
MMPRAFAALLAGTVGILLNMAALDAADQIPLATGHGGLLRFLTILTGGTLRIPSDGTFRLGFHIAAGLALAQIYAFALEPVLHGPSWLRGLPYAAAVWLANALIVLPATGAGVAGSRSLTVAGIAWFAAAHTLFFVTLAILYARLRHNSASLWRRRRAAPEEPGVG